MKILLFPLDTNIMWSLKFTIQDFRSVLNFIFGRFYIVIGFKPQKYSIMLLFDSSNLFISLIRCFRMICVTFGTPQTPPLDFISLVSV